MRRLPKYNSEHNLYEQIARYLQLQYPNVIYRFDVGADLKLTMGQAVKHKRLHPERGYPDLFIAKTKEIKVKTVLGSGYSLVEIKPLGGLYIEIKKDGEKLTKKMVHGEHHISPSRLKHLRNCVRGAIKLNLGLGLANVSKLLTSI